MAKRSKKTGGAAKEKTQKPIKKPAPEGAVKMEPVDVGMDVQDSQLEPPLPQNKTSFRYFVAEGRAVSCLGGIYDAPASRERGGITEDDVIGGLATLEDLTDQKILVKE